MNNFWQTEQPDQDKDERKFRSNPDSPYFILPECEENLIALVRDLTGIRILDHQLNNFRQTIAQGCQQFHHPNCEEYIKALQVSSLNSAIQEHLIAGITIGESYFFRDRAQMDYLSKVLLPNLILQRRQQGRLYLRIWSAGCSEGQELFSILMLLDQLLPDLENWNLHLLGTDINVLALANALKGEYSEWSLRSTNNTVRNHYFNQQGKTWKIKPELQRKTKFSYLNLYGDNFPSILSETNALDLILCRNVFIYFDQATASTVMNKLFQSLAPGGYLLQGASDLVDGASQCGFEHHIHDTTSYFRRPLLGRSENSEEINFSDSANAFNDPERMTFISSSQSTSGSSSLDTNSQHSISKNTSSRNTSSRNKSSDENLNQSTEPKVEKIDTLTPIPIALKAYKGIIQFLTKEDWSQAMVEIDQHIDRGDDNALIWQFRAKALANLGRSKEALEACNTSIRHDPEDKHTYFIQALVYMESRRLDKAEEALRRTLYLDRDFVEAHYHMGLLHLLQGKRESGLKSMHNALEIAENADPQRSLHDAAGMNHARMATILRNELRMYQGGK